MKKILSALTLFLLVLPAGANPFPICMYGVNNPADVPAVKKAGFNCFQTYRPEPETLAALARAAKKHRLHVVFRPNKVIGSAYEEAARHWPILAWYLVDEPDVHKWSRDRVIEAREITRNAFPLHENTLVIGQGKTRISYYDLPDNLMMDWYPVPHLALTSFGDNVRWAKEGQQSTGAAERPLWGVVQSFNWKEFKQYRPDNDRIGRFPTEDEIRFMSYDGIINGATGLFYFVFTTHGKPLPTEQPEWWARVAAVSKELAKLQPVLEKGELTDNPVEVTAPLVMQTRRYKRRLYSILINRSDKPVSVPEELLRKEYGLYFGGQKTSEIPPYTVWVLKRKK